MVLRHSKVLHERHIVLHLVFVEEPWVGMERRTTLHPFGNGFWRITMKFGFMNVPDVPRALQLCNKHQGLRLDDDRSEEHTSELQSLMRISYAVFCLKKKTHTNHPPPPSHPSTPHPTVDLPH